MEKSFDKIMMDNKENYTPQEVALMVQVGAVLVSDLYEGKDPVEAIKRYEALLPLNVQCQPVLRNQLKGVEEMLREEGKE